MVDDGTTIFYPDHSSANIVELTGHEIENSHVLSEGLMEMYRFHGFMMNPWLVGLDWPEELSDMGDLQHQHEQQQFSALAMLGHAWPCGPCQNVDAASIFAGQDLSVKNVTGTQPEKPQVSLFKSLCRKSQF